MTQRRHTWLVVIAMAGFAVGIVVGLGLALFPVNETNKMIGLIVFISGMCVFVGSGVIINIGLEQSKQS